MEVTRCAVAGKRCCGGVCGAWEGGQHEEEYQAECS